MDLWWHFVKMVKELCKMRMIVVINRLGNNSTGPVPLDESCEMRTKYMHGIGIPDEQQPMQ
jgi:hypothetical protein